MRILVTFENGNRDDEARVLANIRQALTDRGYSILRVELVHVSYAIDCCETA